MTGRLFIVGLGPGAEGLCTPDAQHALSIATDIVGYGPYVARVQTGPDAVRHISDNREEIERARHALELCESGRIVAVVSSGDAGVFAMASAVFEAIEHGKSRWRDMDISVIPGISAMFAASARLGAPLGHDFCAISLSDNLKPWSVVLDRLQAAARAGFVMALYNARSLARPRQLAQALDCLRGILPGEVPVIFATAISRPEEKILVTTLDVADAQCADMRTLVMIGTSHTHLIERASGAPFVYTRRGIDQS